MRKHGKTLRVNNIPTFTSPPSSPSYSGCFLPKGIEQPLSLLHMRSDTTTVPLSPKVNFYPPPNIPLSPASRAAVPLCRIKISPAHGFSRAKRPLGGYFFTDTSGTSGTKALLCGTEVPIGMGPCKSLQRTEQINGPLGRAKCSSPCEK